jgi:RNA methyltransferase, TrmH family
VFAKRNTGFKNQYNGECIEDPEKNLYVCTKLPCFMISQTTIKLIRSLEYKKFRQKHGLFIAEGRKIIQEALSSDSFITEELFLLSESAGEIQSRYLPLVTEISYAQLQRISLQTTPDFGLALLRIPKEVPVPSPPSGNQVFLLLDSIRDPGNLGTIIRLCDWFGISKLICSEDTTDLFSPKVIQASMGSFCRIDVFYTNPAQWLLSLPPEVAIYGTVLNGTPLHKVSLHKPCVIVTGNESHGISTEVLKYVTKKITIEPAEGSGAESLNAAVAAGIIIYQFCHA